MSTTKIDRLDQVVAVCVKNNLTPNSNAFAAKIRVICAHRFGFAKKTATDYASALIKQWRLDRWEHIVTQNSYLTEKEAKEWLNKNILQPSRA